MRYNSVPVIIITGIFALFMLISLLLTTGCLHPGPAFPIESRFDQPVSIHFNGEKVGNLKPGEDKTLREHGETYLSMIISLPFFQFTFKGFIGVFGYYSVWLPQLIYIAFFSILILSICITGFALHNSWILMDRLEIIAILISPIIILLNIYASLYNSLFDIFNPQGRYIFPSLVPAAFILMGTIFVEEDKLRKIRMISVGTMYLLCIFSLFFLLLYGAETMI